MKLKAELEKQFRKHFPKRIKNVQQFLEALKGKKGLEIGGPSPSFSHKGFLPVYDILGKLDGCNFGNQTVWEGNLEEGENYIWGNQKGYQFISDGSDLSAVDDGTYEVILSCHSIEHFANPIKALKEWNRVLTPEGCMLLVVPHKDGTFDHNRPITMLSHLVQDYEINVPESDETHFEEVISLHDIKLDQGVSSIEELVNRTRDNMLNRCVHHHIFNTPLVVQLADYMKMQVLQIEHFNPFNIVALLKKSALPNNLAYFDKAHSAYQKFPSDKIWP